MLVIGCWATNWLSVSCQVFSVVECLIIKTVEKTFKTSRIFPLLDVFNCLRLLHWHCMGQKVGRPSVAAGKTGDGDDLCGWDLHPWSPGGGFCREWLTCQGLILDLPGTHLVSGLVFIYCSGYVRWFLFLTRAYNHTTRCSIQWLQRQGMCLRTWISQGILAVLQSNRSCLAFLWSWPGMLSLADCQVLQVWEENLVPGKNSFIKWGVPIFPSERKFMVKCEGSWFMALSFDGCSHRYGSNPCFLVRDSWVPL